MKHHSSPELRHFLKNAEIAVLGYQTVIKKASLGWKITTQMYLQRQVKLAMEDRYFKNPAGHLQEYEAFLKELENDDHSKDCYAYAKICYAYDKSSETWKAENKKMAIAGASEFEKLKQKGQALTRDLMLVAYLEALIGLGPDILKKSIQERTSAIGIDSKQEISEAWNYIQASQMLLNRHIKESTDYHPVVMEVAY